VRRVGRAESVSKPIFSKDALYNTPSQARTIPFARLPDPKLPDWYRFDGNMGERFVFGKARATLAANAVAFVDQRELGGRQAGG